jgi:hypothetical protein
LAVALACFVPLWAGAAGVVLGTAVVEEDIGRGHVEISNHFRYLSGLLLGICIAIAASIPTIERRSELFTALTFMVVLGGLARLWGLLAYDLPVPPQMFALTMELGAAPLLFVWQRRVSLAFRLSSRRTSRQSSRWTPLGHADAAAPQAQAVAPREHLSLPRWRVRCAVIPPCR